MVSPFIFVRVFYVQLIITKKNPQPNHLNGSRRTFLQLRFKNVNNLLAVRKSLFPAVQANNEKLDAFNIYADTIMADLEDTVDDYNGRSKVLDAIDNIIDIREYDVPYHVRVAIDKSKLHMDIYIYIYIYIYYFLLLTLKRHSYR